MLETTSAVTSSLPIKTTSSSAAYGATTISERQNRHGMVSIINTSIIIPVCICIVYRYQSSSFGRRSEEWSVKQQLDYTRTTIFKSYIRNVPHSGWPYCHIIYYK